MLLTLAARRSKLGDFKGMRRFILFGFLSILSALPAFASQTYFVRADGGTRFSVAVPAGQCDGLSDLPAAGATAKHCAFNDVRYLWSDNSSAPMAWVLAGGDTAVIRGCTALVTQDDPANPNCRIGYDNNGHTNTTWCGSGVPNTNCIPPPVPSGTSGVHTHILGGCAFDSTPGPCHTIVAVGSVTNATPTVGPPDASGNITVLTNLSTLFSGFGLSQEFDLTGSQWVDIAGLEFTTHNKVVSGNTFAASHAYSLGDTIFDGTSTGTVTTAGTSGASLTLNPTILGFATTGGAVFQNNGPNCVRAGVPQYPVECQHSALPIDDYGDQGIATYNTTGNITFTDVWVHGFSASGFYGPIGGAITMTRVNSSFNEFAGWNFDLGTPGPNNTGIPNNPAASITASFVTMDWNGCNQEYPMLDPIPALVCYSILNNGFGDAWSGQDSNLASMTCDHCEIANNIKDGFFGPHTSVANVLISHSYAANNGGGTWKGNMGGNGAWKMVNTVTNANCGRTRQPFTGAPSTYNLWIADADRCRADGATHSLTMPIAGSFEEDDNTFISASINVGHDFACWSVATGAGVFNGGSGYTVGDLLWIGGGGTNATVTSVGGGGVITGVTMTTAGQVLSTSAFNENYIFGGTGSGAILSITGATPISCNGGPRILRNNNFIGYTNSDNVSWNGQTINAFCYSGCQGQPGIFDDTMWTIRSNNNFFGFVPGNDGACTYAGETCVNPLMMNEPSQTWVNAAQLDQFSIYLGIANSFYPGGTSPLLNAGIPVTGITADFYGVTRSVSTPTIGGVESVGGGTSPSGGHISGHGTLKGNGIIK